MTVCQSPSFKNNLVVFTECKHFYIIEISGLDEFEIESKQSSNMKISNPEERNFSICHQVKMKFPSKHVATSMLQLHGDIFVTVSLDGLEYWNLQRQKRTKLVQTPYGQISHAQSVGTSEQHIRIICSEYSRVLRIFSEKRFLERVLTNHNDSIVKMLKVDGQNVIITASIDGALKYITAVTKIFSAFRAPLVLNPFD